MPTLLLVDGHSQAYRAFFGVKTPLMTRRGELTTAVFGFARKLLSVLKEYAPDYVAVAFDVGETWRHKSFPEYKATRDRMPSEMRDQMTRIEEMLAAFKIPIVTRENYEADDVLGSLARQAAEKGYDVLILTGDRDMFQLVDDHVKILYTSGGPNPKTSLYGPKEILDRYGLTPQQFIDMKALIGDPSDNIPGIPGIGEKTAIKYLKQYGSLDELYAHIDEIRGPKTRQNLLTFKDQVFKNRELVTIVTDLDLGVDPESLRWSGYDPNAVRTLFEELEFRSLLRELSLLGDRQPSTGPADTETGQLSLFGITETPPSERQAEIAPEAPYTVVQTGDALNEVVEHLKKAPYISFDVETTSTDAMQAQLVGLGVAWDKGQAAYIPVMHQNGQQLPWEKVRQALQPVFGDESKPKLAHNSKYDLIVCRRHGLDVAGEIHDTMIMAWLLDPASRMLGLKSQANHELGWVMTELKSLIGAGRKQVTMDHVSVAEAAAYCGADVDATIHLYETLVPRLKEAGMWDLYRNIELPLLPVLADMEMAGILLDTDFLAELSTKLGDRLATIEQQLFSIVGHEFNLRSTQQLSHVLFDELGFPTRGLRKTSSGFYSTAASELDKLVAMSDQLSADQHQVLDLIFEHRQLEKLRGTYVDALPALVNPQTKRLHTSFNQTGTSTGRVSSSDPNLQNIPIRTEMGRQIRRAFVAPPGWLLLAADYSQVELRVLAHVAQEEGLIDAFRQGLDIHKATAAKLFGVPVEQVNRDQRALAKTINFATIYGVSAYGLSSRTEMSPTEAQQFLDQYFQTYPKVKEYITRTIEKVNSDCYVETLLGRKRYFPELQNPRLPYNQRQAIERAAINAPIQGTAADIIKIAMIRLHRHLRQDGYRSRMLLQVHDELVLEIPKAEKGPVANLVRETMESAYELDVPLKVDVEIGANWLDMEEL
jgi:DNA polymerase-1